MERPLIGEPLSVDLLNTRWIDAGGERDLLSTRVGLATWLAERDLPEDLATEPVRATLVHTRAVLGGEVENAAGAGLELNAILARGLVVRSLHGDQMAEHVLFPDETWRLAWTVADSYLRLRTAGRGQIRQCQGPSCVLYFHDPTGRRRWCSMAECGNRAKARRHHERTRARRC